jgi:hypothetical protein
MQTYQNWGILEEETNLRYEDGVAALEEIEDEIRSYKSKLSEADTRCKIIDKILINCLGWREKDLRREEHVNEGYIDYIMRLGKKGLIVEAKKNNPLFELPVGVGYSSNLTIDKLLKKEKSLNQHYDQVLNYCLNAAIQFGCFTNGLEWVIFTAVRTDGIKINLSKVVVFRGFQDIKDNFIGFWNLFSRESIENGTINNILLPESKHIPISQQINSGDKKDQTLERNPLSHILSPVLPNYFGDLIGPELIKKLEECYVESKPFSLWSREEDNLSTTVGDRPKIIEYADRDRVLNHLYSSTNAFMRGTGKSGIIYVLLGRIGSGKSTFLNHFFFVRNKLIHEKNIVFLLNWLEYSGLENIDDFFYTKIRELSKQNPLFIENSSFDVLEKAFQNDIIELKKGPLGNIDDEDVINNKIADLLISLSEKREYYYSRLFDYLRKKKGITIFLIFDNIDQLEPAQQESIFKFAFSIYEKWSSFTLISMREDTYVKSKIEGSLSTVQCSQILLPRQSIIPIIERRLECLINDIETGACELPPDLSELDLTRLDVGEYIRLISSSITSQRDRVKNFLEAIAQGNIRESLDFFRTFLTAGNTNSKKIIEIMKKNNTPYLIPDHEFIKSISLGSNRFFSEAKSPILNLFSIQDMESPSHFTKLRILWTLSVIQDQQRIYGTGYESIDRIKGSFKSIGISEEDLNSSIMSLIMKGLIENDLHSRKHHNLAKAVRITPSGDYYRQYLCHQFAYLDLMLHDTPIFDERSFESLHSLIETTLLDKRFKRVFAFIDYLKEQEEGELATIKKIVTSELLTHSLMPDIIANCEKNITRIERRLEGRSVD